MQTIRAMFAAAALVMTSCATIPETPPAYNFQFKDEPENHRFVLILTSTDSRTLCVSADNWMWMQGDTLFNGYPLQTKQGERRADLMAYSDAGMVCGLSDDPDCGRFRLNPGEQRRTEIPYSLYGDPKTLADDQDKHFDFHADYPGVELCKKA